MINHELIIEFFFVMSIDNIFFIVEKMNKVLDVFIFLVLVFVVKILEKWEWIMELLKWVSFCVDNGNRMFGIKGKKRYRCFW